MFIFVIIKENIKLIGINNRTAIPSFQFIKKSETAALIEERRPIITLKASALTNVETALTS